MTAIHPVHAIDHPSEHTLQGLETAVEGALWSFEPLRTTKSLIDVQASADGEVELTGNVRSDIMKAMAGRFAARVPGVTAVDNRIASDPEIESRVAAALGSGDLALFTDTIDVESRLGTVYLGGTVTTDEKEAAETRLEHVVAAIGDIDGVHAVINRAVVVEGTAEAAAEEAEEATDGEVDEARAAMEERLSVWRERAGQEVG